MIKADIFSALIQCNEVMQQNILPPPQDRQYQEIIIFVIYDDDYYYYHYYHYYHWLLGAVNKWRHHFRWVSLQTTHVLRVHRILSIHGWSEVESVDTCQKWWRHLWTTPYLLFFPGPPISSSGRSWHPGTEHDTIYTWGIKMLFFATNEEFNMLFLAKTLGKVKEKSG